MKTKQVFPIASVALAVAMVAPTASAEVEAYLSLRPTIESTKDAAGDRTTEVDDYYSRFGVKGSQQFGDLTVGAVGEFRAYDNKITEEGSYELSRARYAYGYISGDLGKLTIGMTPDVMANNVTSFTELGYSDGESFSRFFLNGHNGGGFKDHNVRYTFKTDAFSADVAARRVSDSVSEYNIGGQYYLGDITLGAAYKLENGAADNEKFESKSAAIGASYSKGPLTVAGTYLRVDVNGNVATADDATADDIAAALKLNTLTPTSIEVAAAYSVSDKVTVNAIYTKFDDNTSDSAYSVGMTYQIAPSALLFTTYEDVDDSYTKATVGFKFDLNIMSAGGMQ